MNFWSIKNVEKYYISINPYSSSNKKFCTRSVRILPPEMILDRDLQTKITERAPMSVLCLAVFECNATSDCLNHTV